MVPYLPKGQDTTITVQVRLELGALYRSPGLCISYFPLFSWMWCRGGGSLWWNLFSTRLLHEQEDLSSGSHLGHWRGRGRNYSPFSRWKGKWQMSGSALSEQRNLFLPDCWGREEREGDNVGVGVGMDLKLCCQPELFVIFEAVSGTRSMPECWKQINILMIFLK